MHRRLCAGMRRKHITNPQQSPFFELELELILSQMAQKPMLRGEVAFFAAHRSLKSWECLNSEIPRGGWYYFPISIPPPPLFFGP